MTTIDALALGRIVEGILKKECSLSVYPPGTSSPLGVRTQYLAVSAGPFHTDDRHPTYRSWSCVADTVFDVVLGLDMTMNGVDPDEILERT